MRAQVLVSPMFADAAGGDLEERAPGAVAGRDENTIAADQWRRGVDVVVGFPRLPPQFLPALRIETDQVLRLEKDDRALAGNVRNDRRRVARFIVTALPDDVAVRLVERDR